MLKVNNNHQRSQYGRYWPTRFAKDFFRPRVMFVGSIHLVLFAASMWIAFCLRFDFAVPGDSLQAFWLALPWVMGLKYVIFLLAGHFHGWWRHVSFSDLTSLIYAAAISLLVIATVDHLLLPFQIPRAVLILDCIVAIGLLGAIRGMWRMFREGISPVIFSNDLKVALLVGASGEHGILAHHLNSDPKLGYRIRGLIDRDNSRVGTHLGQLPIVGGEEDLAYVAEAYDATHILVSAESLTGNRLRTMISRCKDAGLELKVIPPPQERFNGGSRIPIREIKIDDLLGREPVVLDTDQIERLITGQAVMVTGAGGSIGSEICRQVMKFNPKKLILVDQAENNLFWIDRELQSVAIQCGTDLQACVADVTDKTRMHGVFVKDPPNLVFHAAAHKHVPLMEINVGEALHNNVIGTKTIADLSDEFRVSKFVLISTDKAVNPTSVMGVTKHLAERYVHSLSQVAAHTEYIAVRFGNVLGSVGSVVPVFQEQIRKGGPITITDKRMRRYFMTIPEASQLVLQSATLGKGGEIFVLDMGEPVRIVDLAWDLIRLSGLPVDSIEIEVSGIRPGEKLYEELYFDEEDTLPTQHPKIRAAYHRYYPFSEVSDSIQTINWLVDKPAPIIRNHLKKLVPEYQRDETENPEQLQSVSD